MVRQARPRVVLFDIDNTLTCTDGAGRRALERAVREITGTVAPMPRVAYAGRTDPSILAELLAGLGEAAEEARTGAIMARYVALLEGELARARGRVLPGVADLLDALEARPHVQLGLLTGNVVEGARLKLGAHGLWHRFGFGAYGPDAPTRPGLLPVALERARTLRGELPGFAHTDVYVVGDTVHDVAVARAHGAVAVAVGTGAPHQDRGALLATAPDHFCETLADAAPLLAALDAGT